VKNLTDEENPQQKEHPPDPPAKPVKQEDALPWRDPGKAEWRNMQQWRDPGKKGLGTRKPESGEENLRGKE
jgi:hypothetical protein